MIQLDVAPDDAPEQERVTLFAIGETEYSVPAKPRVNVALRYLRNVRKIGPVLAESALLEDLLGEDGYEALCGFEDLTPENMQAISEAANKLALGVLEDDSQGNG